MRSALAQRAARLRSTSISAVPPPKASSDYSTSYADVAASILYQSPLPSQAGFRLYILNAAAFPDADEVDYDSLLPYVLARLPGEEDLIAGEGYEIIFFAGGQPDSSTGEKRSGPGLGWYLQAYHVLSRATRKRLQKLWVVHERSWVRVLIEVFGTIVSPKFKKKIVHVSTLSGLALHLPLEKVLIPPSVYLHDRRVNPDIYVPYVTGRRAFAANDPLPRSHDGKRRLPRVLRETTSFLCLGDNMKEEGLFRIPAHSILSNVLREAYDRGQRFIVWKNLTTVYAEPSVDKTTLAEIHQSDAYGLPMAAGLIKVWYRELKTPVFPEVCYDELRHVYGDPDQPISLEDLTNLFSPSSDNSMLSYPIRLVLTWHLFPLLSMVSSFESDNRMSPANLAICFSPCLVCGSDQMQDAKMTSIIRRILERAIELWPSKLEKACGTSAEEFVRAISPPEDDHDYEDPLYETFTPGNRQDDDGEAHRIVLEDSETVEVERPPRLPPRTSSLPRGQSVGPPPALQPRRKPVPPFEPPPRYSTIHDGSPTESLVAYVSNDDSSQPRSKTASQGTSNEKSALADAQNGFPDAATEKSGPLQPELVLPAQQATSSDDLPIPDRSRAGSDAVKRKPVSAMSVPLLSEITAKSAQLRSVSGDSTASANYDDDAVFIKPTWAASSRQVSSSSTSSNRRPSPPLQVAKNDQRKDSISCPPPYLPKPRTPSPGLLQRMASIEREQNSSFVPLQQSGVRKQSVDDLRRIYEERAGTVASLDSAVRRSSSTSSRT